MGTKIFIKTRISPLMAPRCSGGRAGATALLRPPLTALAKCRADIGHDAIDNTVASVAAVGQAALTVAPKKAVEPSMKRPTRILVARVFRMQELPREDIDFAVGHLARPAIDGGDSRCFRPGRSLPPCIHDITSLSRKGIPDCVRSRRGYTPYTVDLRCARAMGHCLSARDLRATIRFDDNRTS
jgi:hypothetical protein